MRLSSSWWGLMEIRLYVGMNMFIAKAPSAPLLVGVSHYLTGVPPSSSTLNPQLVTSLVICPLGFDHLCMPSAEVPSLLAAVFLC